MIKAQVVIKSNGSRKSLFIPQFHTIAEIFSDDEFFYFFESKEEAQEFYKTLPIVEYQEIKPEQPDLISIINNATEEQLNAITDKLIERIKSKL